MPRFREYPEAGSLEPTDAFAIDRIGVGTMFIEGEAMSVGSPYLFSWSNLGPALGDSEIMGGHVFALGCSIPANMTGTVFAVDQSSLPTGPITADVLQVSGVTETSVGTMTIQADGSYAFSTVAAIYQIGDLVKFVGPAAHDGRFANMWLTGVGVVF
jgi:hypothetical protein